MKLIYLSLFALLVLPSKAQRLLDRYEHSSQYTRTQACEVIGNEVFYSKSHHRGFTVDLDFEHWLMKADDQLNRLDSVELRSLLNINGASTLYLRSLKAYNGGPELILQSRDTSFNCESFRSYVLHFDAQLNLLDSQSVGDQNHNFFAANTFDLNNQRHVAGHGHQCTNGTWGNSQQGIANLSLANSNQMIAQIQNGNPISFFAKVSDSLFIYSSAVYNLFSNWVALNQDWQLFDYGGLVTQATAPLPGQARQFLPIAFIKRPNKLPVPLSMGYSLGSGAGQNPHWNLCIGAIDTLNDQTISDTLPMGHTTIPLGPLGYFLTQSSMDMLDAKNPQKVFIGLLKQGMSPQNYLQRERRDFYTYSYNVENMSLNVVRKMTPEYPWDHNFAVSSFSDGRILLGMNEYNYDQFGDSSLAIHWIVMPNGGFLSEQEPTFQSANFSLYPNPSQSVLNIELLNPRLNMAEYKISSLNGRVLLQGTLSGPKTSLPLKQLGLKPGMYLMQLRNEGRAFSRPQRFILR